MNFYYKGRGVEKSNKKKCLFYYLILLVDLGHVANKGLKDDKPKILFQLLDYLTYIVYIKAKKEKQC